MGWLSDLLGFALYQDGVAVATRKALNFVGSGFTLSDDPANDQAIVRFTASSVIDPTTGFVVPLLPQVDTSAQTTDATPADVATIALSDNTVYEFGCYVQAYAAAYANETVQKFGAVFRRSNGGSATNLATLPEVFINPLAITGLSLVASGNNVIVRWTGHASTTLRARIQVGYTSRPITLPV